MTWRWRSRWKLGRQEFPVGWPRKFKGVRMDRALYRKDRKERMVVQWIFTGNLAVSKPRMHGKIIGLRLTGGGAR